MLSQSKWQESWLGWIYYYSKLNYKLRTENQVSGSLLRCFFAFSALFMLLKGVIRKVWCIGGLIARLLD